MSVLVLLEENIGCIKVRVVTDKLASLELSGVFGSCRGSLECG